MRFHPLIQMDKRAWRFVSQAIGSVERCEPVMSGKIASVYRLSNNGHTYCLKISANGEAKKEAGLYPLISQNVPVPELIRSEGRLMLTRWLDGTTMEEALALKSVGSDERRIMAFLAGETLADVHSVRMESFGYVLDGEQGVSSAKDFLEERIDSIFTSKHVREGFGLVMVDDLSRFCKRHAKLFDGSPVLLHGDYKANNINVSEGRVNGIYDFGESYAGLPVWDFGKFFRHVTDRFPDMKRPFLNGYGRKGVIDEEYELKVRVFDVFTVLLTVRRLMESSMPEDVLVGELRKYTEIIRENLYLVKP